MIQLHVDASSAENVRLHFQLIKKIERKLSYVRAVSCRRAIKADVLMYVTALACGSTLPFENN